MSLSSQFTQANIVQLQDDANVAPRYYVRNAGTTAVSAGTTIVTADASIAATDIVMVSPKVAATTPAQGYVLSVSIIANTSFTITTVGNSTAAQYNYVIYRSLD